MGVLLLRYWVVMITKVFGILSAACFVGSFIAFTWLRAVRYKARRVLEDDGAEPEPSEVGSDVIRAIDSDLAARERMAWLVWGLLTVCCVGFGLAAMALGR